MQSISSRQSVWMRRQKLEFVTPTQVWFLGQLASSAQGTRRSTQLPLSQEKPRTQSNFVSQPAVVWTQRLFSPGTSWHSRPARQSSLLWQAPPPAKMHCLIGRPSRLSHPDSMQTKPTEQSSFVSHNPCHGNFTVKQILEGPKRRQIGVRVSQLTDIA